MKARLVILLAVLAMFAGTASGLAADLQQDQQKRAAVCLEQAQYRENNIIVEYPRLVQVQDQVLQQNVNTIITNEALRILEDYTPEERVKLALTLRYELKYHSANLLSLAFSGQRYLEGSAYPVHVFFTVNIDLRNGRKIRLDDIVTIDEAFVSKVRNGNLHALSPALTLESRQFTAKRLMSVFGYADYPQRQNPGSVYSYFTKDLLGISVGVIHALGDHAEFELRYQEIESCLRGPFPL